jgi:mannose-6-phosphate isomerase-like protein (cupin superfamily)
MMEEIKLEKDFKRPWGGFIKFIDNSPCTVKILQIKKGESLSLQYHKFRKEFWYLISGKIKVTLNKRKRTLKEGNYVFIAKKVLHRAEGLVDSKILEISTGKFKENDEIRVEDKYKRSSPK